HAADPITKNFRCISANCCDQHEWCGFWAGIGECETNEKWMIGNCQISCKKCDDVNSTTAAPVTESGEIFTLHSKSHLSRFSSCWNTAGFKERNVLSCKIQTD
ncbi:putative shTK domain protein, partial [Trichinella nativa]